MTDSTWEPDEKLHSVYNWCASSMIVRLNVVAPDHVWWQCCTSQKSRDSRWTLLSELPLTQFSFESLELSFIERGAIREFIIFKSIQRFNERQWVRAWINRSRPENAHIPIFPNPISKFPHAWSIEYFTLVHINQPDSQNSSHLKI